MQHPGLCFLGAREPRSAGFRAKLMWHSPGGCVGILGG
jgi:hypothetical protein